VQHFLQLVVAGVITGSEYAVLGVGFGLILGVTGRFHFAFAITYTLAAYVATSITNHIDHTNTARAIVAIAAGLAAAVAVGVLIEIII
jgi:branched-chain amino acid transport system permease protein